jgi:hypothetical protein
MLPTAVNAGGTGAFRVWTYAWWRRRSLAPLYLFGRFWSTPGWTTGGRGAAWHWWDYVAVNVRLRKEEEEALLYKGGGNDDNSYKGREGRRGGK